MTTREKKIHSTYHLFVSSIYKNYTTTTKHHLLSKTHQRFVCCRNPSIDNTCIYHPTSFLKRLQIPDERLAYSWTSAPNRDFLSSKADGLSNSFDFPIQYKRKGRIVKPLYVVYIKHNPSPTQTKHSKRLESHYLHRWLILCHSP